MKKVLSIISAALIAIASIGFLIIPQFFGNEITKLETDNGDIIFRQKGAYDLFEKANSSREYFGILEGQLDIYNLFSRDSIKIKQKETRINQASLSSAVYALNQAYVTKKMLKMNLKKSLRDS